LVVKCAPCLVNDSTHPWSTVASKCVPSASGGLMICWVERGVRNQREVVIVWGRWGRSVFPLYLENSAPIRLPRIKARIGPLAATGEIGGIEIGGRTNQLRVAPHTIAAKERMAVGAVNRILSLWGLRRGGC